MEQGGRSVTDLDQTEMLRRSPAASRITGGLLPDSLQAGSEHPAILCQPFAEAGTCYSVCLIHCLLAIRTATGRCPPTRPRKAQNAESERLRVWHTVAILRHEFGRDAPSTLVGTAGSICGAFNGGGETQTAPPAPAQRRAVGHQRGCDMRRARACKPWRCTVLAHSRARARSHGRYQHNPVQPRKP
jgi:hypothetical protein